MSLALSKSSENYGSGHASRTSKCVNQRDVAAKPTPKGDAKPKEDATALMNWGATVEQPASNNWATPFFRLDERDTLLALRYGRFNCASLIDRRLKPSISCP